MKSREYWKISFFYFLLVNCRFFLCVSLYLSISVCLPSIYFVFTLLFPFCPHSSLTFSVKFSLTLTQQETFLQDAVNSYLQCLQHTDKYDLGVVFRLVSLWFNNISNLRVNETLKKTLSKIASRKFLPLMYQI